MNTVPLMERPKDRKPWGLILALVVAAVAGVVSIPLQVAVFRNLDNVTEADIERNARLIEQVRMLEEASFNDVEQHRHFNQADHNCIVALALLLADPARDRSVQPIPPPECVNAPAVTAERVTPKPTPR